MDTQIRFTTSPVHPRATRLTTAIEVPCPVETVFEFFADAGNLQLITPPWLSFCIESSLPIDMRPGTLIDYRLRLRGIPVRWRTEISDWTVPDRFVDRQLKGPYRLWEHTHTFEPTRSGTSVIDNVDYIAPGGRPVDRWFVRPNLKRIFTYRRESIATHFQTQCETISPTG